MCNTLTNIVRAPRTIFPVVLDEWAPKEAPQKYSFRPTTVIFKIVFFYTLIGSVHRRVRNSSSSRGIRIFTLRGHETSAIAVQCSGY